MRPQFDRKSSDLARFKAGPSNERVCHLELIRIAKAHFQRFLLYGGGLKLAKFQGKWAVAISGPAPLYAHAHARTHARCGGC